MEFNLLTQLTFLSLKKMKAEKGISDMKKVDLFQLKHWYLSSVFYLLKICFT